MQVKQRLKINAMVLAAAALAIVVMFLLALYHLNKANDLAEISGDIVLNSFERVTLSNDYLQHDNERAKAQWFARHEETARRLQSASKKFPPAEAKEVVAPMLKRHESIGKIFSAIVENREKDKATAEDAVLSREVEGRLLSQLNIKVYEEVVFGRELLESSRKKRSSIMRLAGIGIAGLFLILLSAVTLNAWTTARAITDRVRRLHEGASAIGGGNLDQRIDITGNDEFAELAGAFNAMTTKLQGSYHDLIKEIEERKRAEEALRTAHQELEVRVQERTRELKAAENSLRVINETLEQRVEERTVELQAANASLRDSRRATLNMMEDALAARRRVEEASVELSREVIERKRAEEAARRGEDQFRTLADSIPNLAWWANADGYITWYNRRWYEYTGTTPQEMEGWGWQSVHDPEMLPAVLERWRASIATGEPFEMEFPLRGADGIFRPFLTRVLPMKDSAGRVFRWFGTNTDIAGRKKAEADVLKLSEDMAARNVELEDLNRELEAFIYSVSHDLRAPLRTMAAFVGFLCEDYSGKLDVQAKEYLTRISRSSEKMSKLIEDLLDLSRLSRQEINRTEVDLSAMAASIISGLQEADPERGVEVCIQEGLAGSADPALAESVLVNLIGNAWKFTSKTAGARIEFGTIEKDGETVYYVRDNGAGFDPRHAEKMFQPFHRLHSIEEFEGTGIGLAIVERIIRRHKGKIWAEGEAGRGAAVYFTLG